MALPAHQVEKAYALGREQVAAGAYADSGTPGEKLEHLVLGNTMLLIS